MKKVLMIAMLIVVAMGLAGCPHFQRDRGSKHHTYKHHHNDSEHGNRH